jgi:hypothetical protein
VYELTKAESFELLMDSPAGVMFEAQENIKRGLNHIQAVADASDSSQFRSLNPICPFLTFLHWT